MMTLANETQVGGAHYQAEYQHWDLVADTGMGYFEGQVTKYLSRWKKKHGLQDLQKAKHFAQKYAEITQGSTRRKPVAQIEQHLFRYAVANPHLGTEESQVLTLLAHSHDVDDVGAVNLLILRLIRAVKAEAGAEPGPGYVNQGDLK